MLSMDDTWWDFPVRKEKTKYTKINKWGCSYYVRTELLAGLTKDLLGTHSSVLTMMQYSDFVVDGETNKMIKCRSIIEDVLDHYTGN